MSYAKRFENLAAPHSGLIARYLGEDADDEIAALRAENERLRKSLTEIARLGPYGDCPRIARNALAIRDDAAEEEE